MKNIASIFALIAATFLWGCSTTPPHRDYAGVPATEIIVTISCSEPGMRFTGTIVSDGHSEELSGSGSGTFQATGHEFVCSFKKTDAAGRITIAVAEAGNNLGESSTLERFGGVRAELVRTPSRQHTVFTTF